MAETQLINQLKIKVSNLESALSDKQRELVDLKGIEQQADSKIKAMNKIHNDKVRSLLNSIQILKKEKASLQSQSKQHNRSKLIKLLNKEVMDQDLVIDVLRQFIYKEKGKEEGRKQCDNIIVSALKKGPQRVRAVTREELRMEIERLKSLNLNKAKNIPEADNKIKNFGQTSQVSQVSDHSFINQNEQLFKKLKDIQNENQGLKLELSTKGKIIDKLKNQIKEKDRFKSQVQLLTNQLQVSARKVMTLQGMMKQTNQKMHRKIGQLYERQLIVQELQMNSKEHGQRFKQAEETAKLFMEQIQQEKEQLQTQIDLLKKENEGLMFEKMSMKNRQQDQKKKIQEIRQINSKNKTELSLKLKSLETQLLKENQEKNQLINKLRSIQSKYFEEREKWIEERQQLIDEKQTTKEQNLKAKSNQITSEELNRLRKQNQDLKEIIENGTSGSDNKILLGRLQNYRMRVQFLESRGDKSKERELYDQLYQKYNKLLNEYERLKNTSNEVSSQKHKKMNIVQISPNQEQRLNQINSGISDMSLDEVGSSILDNYDSSYDYELRVSLIDHKKYKDVPRITQDDKELLKLISSDLWCFVKDDVVDKKINEVLDASDKYDQMQEEQLAQRIRKIRNISHPQGKKLVVYDSELKEMEEISQNVSITSALQPQIDQYDSDINIEVKKTIKGTPSVNMRGLNKMSDSVSDVSVLSSIKSGTSDFVRRKKGEKASVLKLDRQSKELSLGQSSMSSEMNSSVSSVGVNEQMLQEMNSDISVDFRKKKNKK